MKTVGPKDLTTLRENMNRDRISFPPLLDGLALLAQLRPRDPGKVEGHGSHPVLLKQPLSQRVRCEANLIGSSPSHLRDHTCLDFMQVLAKIPTTEQPLITHKGILPYMNNTLPGVPCVSDPSTVFTLSLIHI